MIEHAGDGTGATSMAASLQRALRWIGPLAGSVVGIGALAFSGGFLAQRAQYDLVQVPFVFVDYWAYAETGVTGFVRSVNLLLGSPLFIALIAVASIAIILSLEHQGFRRFLGRAHWPFLAYVLLIGWLGLILHQQLAVRQLRVAPQAVEETAATIDGWSHGERNTVPARFPFSWLIPDPALPPDPASFVAPSSSFAWWEQIAEELEWQTGLGAVYLEVRPRPTWVVPPKPPDGDNAAEPALVLGIPVDASRLEASRAEELYRALLWTWAVGLWAFVGIGLWQRQVLEALPRSAKRSEEEARLSHAARFVGRRQEELWFCSRWVLRLVAVALLATTALFLMPECYGLLALPRLGQEYVEVVTGSNGDAEADVSNASSPSVDVNRETLNALRLLNRHSGLSLNELDDLRQEWANMVADLERVGSREAAGVLRVMRDAAEPIDSELSDIARESFIQVASGTLAAAEGFILYYPRSETDYLRILQQNPYSSRQRWTIFPVKMEEIVEVRVARDERTVRLVDLLRSLPGLDTDARKAALFEAGKLGHPQLLEVSIGGTYDTSHEIRGFSITDIGRYAAGLPETRDSRRRQRLAIRRLKEILGDGRERPDHRATAATSLHRIATTGDAEVCGYLIDLLGGEEERERDAAWQIRGSLITTIGILRCRQAERLLLELVDDAEIPERVRGSIPSQLLQIGTHEVSAAKLGRLINDPSTPRDVVATAVTALSGLAGDDPSIAIAALVEFLRLDEYSPELVELGQVELMRRSAIDSLRRLGDHGALETFHQLVDRARESDFIVRGKAAVGLGELGDPSSEAVLIDVAEDDAEVDEVRAVAVDALEGFHNNRVVLRLVALFDEAPEGIQAQIVKTLNERGDRGSSLARTEGERLAKRLRESSVTRALEEQAEESIEELQPPPTERSGDDRQVATRTLRVGEQALGFLDPGDDRVPGGSYLEVWKLVGNPGESVTIDLISSEFDPVLFIEGPGLEGTLVDDDDGGACNARLTIDKMGNPPVYVVAVTSAPGTQRKTGRFRLAASSEPPPRAEGSCMRQ